MLKFIVESSLFYTSLSNKNNNIDINPLIKNFILIVENLTSGQKYQIKLFMNYLYSNLVEKKENLTFHLLNSVISDSLNNWPQQNGIIIYYEVTSHNESKLKNYLVEEKIQMN